MNRIFLIVLLFSTAVSLPAQNAGELVTGRGGMVVSASAEASAVGADILRRGGNAVDAAVAVGFTLAVTYPSAGNIGGGCYIVLRMADGREAAIDARETAPAAAHRDMYLDSLGRMHPTRSLVGPLAAGVPGSVDGLLTALDRFGTMSREEVMAPAIHLARDGFPLHRRLARHMNIFRERFSRFPQTLHKFVNGEEGRRAGPAARPRSGSRRESTSPEEMIGNPPPTPWSPADIWRQPDLARTLQRISDQGRDGFYRGETARLIAGAMRQDGGLITERDLASYHSIVREPLRGQYRGYDILSMPPSSSGGVALLQMLGMLERRRIALPEGGDAATAHYMAEAMRRAFADRAAFLGDPAFTDIPLGTLLSDAYLDSLYNSIDPERATPSTEIRSGLLPVPEGTHTTHYSIVDADGNAVSVTTTINSSFGSLYVVPGAGFLLNNEMDDFAAQPGVPNQFGLLGSEANSIQPGKRMLSSMTPTIVMRDGKVFMVTGSPGGSRIITTVLQSILHVVDAGRTVREAVTLPRMHHQWYPDRIIYEDGAFDAVTRRALERMGYECRRDSDFGRCDAIVVDINNNIITGCSDPRGYGTAVAVE